MKLKTIDWLPVAFDGRALSAPFTAKTPRLPVVDCIDETSRVDRGYDQPLVSYCVPNEIGKVLKFLKFKLIIFYVFGFVLIYRLKIIF